MMIATGSNYGLALLASIRRRMGECSKEVIKTMVLPSNDYGYMESSIVSDIKAVPMGVEEHIDRRCIAASITAASKYDKTVERTIQEPEIRIRCLSFSLDYALPNMPNGEVMIATMTATNSLPNTCPGPSRVQYELVTGRKPSMNQHASGRVGLCESRRANSTNANAE